MGSGKHGSHVISGFYLCHCANYALLPKAHSLDLHASGGTWLVEYIQLR